LGWLIDPADKCVYIYRPGQQPECLRDPDTVAGDPILPRFVFRLSDIW
jgi:Uma2 family endonuclease